MNSEILTDAALRQFLLGNVDDQQRQQIESLFITNSVLRERMLAAEQDLIEEYLEDSLTTADKESFLRQYAATPLQQRKLRIAKTIKDRALVKTEVAGAGASSGSGWSRLLERLRLKPMFIVPIAATAMVAIVVGVVWLSSMRQQKSTLEEEVAQLNVPSRLAEVPPHTSTFDLRPGSVRSVESEKELTFGPDTQVVELRLFWPQKERYSTYQAVVRRVSGDWQVTLPDVKPENDGNSIRLRLPARRLTRGNYQVELSGIAPDGSRSFTEEYNFTVGS